MCEDKGLGDAPAAPHVHDRFQAPVHPGHRVVAVCGKGGVGKTAFTAMLARACVRSGSCGRLLVVDADPAFGLALALGVDVACTIGEVRERVIRTAQEGSRAAEAELAARLDYLVLESMVECEDFAFIAMGRSDSLGCYCSVNDLLRDAIQLLAQDFDTVIIDGEAGLEQLNRQVLAGIDDLVVLTDGSSRGQRTVELLERIAIDESMVDPDRISIVVNRPLVDEEHLRTAKERAGSRFLGVVPLDVEVARLDAAGLSLEGLSPESSAAHAVWHIADKLFSR